MLLVETRFDEFTGCVSRVCRCRACIPFSLNSRVLFGRDQVWWACLVHTLPDLVFMTIYSLLILFCAQLYYVAMDVPYEGLKIGFFFINMVLYAAYATIATYSWYQHPYTLFWDGVEWGTGVIYCASIVAILYYGWRVAQLLRPESNGTQAIVLEPDVSRDVQKQRLIVRRVMLLCAVCVLIFSMKAGLSLATVLNVYRNQDGVPLSRGSGPNGNSFAINRYVFDVIVYSAVELVPSWMVLAITHRRRYKPVPGKGSTRSSDETQSSSRADEEMAWPKHLEDEFAQAAAYPPPSPVFPAYGAVDRVDGAAGGLPLEASAGAMSNASVATGSFRSGYYSAASYGGNSNAGGLGSSYERTSGGDFNRSFDH